MEGYYAKKEYKKTKGEYVSNLLLRARKYYNEY